MSALMTHAKMEDVFDPSYGKDWIEFRLGGRVGFIG